MSYDFSSLIKNDYFGYLSVDIKLAKKMKNELMIAHLKNDYNITDNISYDEVSSLLGSNREMKLWYTRWQAAFEFFYDVNVTFDGLDLTKAELDLIKTSVEAINKKRIENSIAMRKAAEEFSKQRDKGHAELVEIIKKSTPLVVVKYINADSLSMWDVIRLNRITDTVARREATRLRVKELKDEALKRLRETKVLDEKDLAFLN